jgi:phage anti-repressor protein
MVSYIYLVCVNYDNKYMYKIGRCSQDPHNHIRRLKSYPKGSKICFVFIVPDQRVEVIETEIIHLLNERFSCVRGKEYFEGDEKEILKILSTKMCHLYSEEIVSCDQCDVKNNITKQIKKFEINKNDHTLADTDVNTIGEIIHGYIEFVKISDVIRWLNATKSALTKTLKLSYKENIDFNRVRPSDDYYKTSSKVNNFVEYLLTPDCFKRLCMMSRSKNAEVIRKLFLCVEKVKHPS